MATGDEFTCALCRGTFEKTRSDEEASTECKDIFGVTPDTEPCAIVCDDCFEKIRPRPMMKKEKVM